MNYLDFFASVISSLSWPISIVAVAWIFRREIRPLLPKLRLKHKDTEIDFRLGEAERAAEQLPPPPPESDPPTPEEQDSFERLARLSPRSALLEVRRSVEDAIEILAEGMGLPRVGSPRHVLRSLRAKQLIDPAVASLFDEVLHLGSIAAHARDVDFGYDDAVRLRVLADKAIRQVAQDLENIGKDGKE
ncbi:DUF4145 domain-containing protein [Rhizobium leguminosarum]|uniref:DUF4145 domain-containing protein n=1 Tax=Rhizobium leguminosarum TaxID=384 RepID=UPI001C9169EF|nr:DUF4145 domain-containing protein [Rhizobium leguminosarum]MBY2950521.1 DUF4145 domain-containing protein [Rhizobium leguminosarum]